MGDFIGSWPFFIIMIGLLVGLVILLVVLRKKGSED
jgi:hypothetical protein